MADRHTEVKAPTRSKRPRIAPSPLLAVPGVQQKCECAELFHSVPSSFPALPRPARSPRGRRAPLPGSSASRLGSPGSRTRGSRGERRPGFRHLSSCSPESVSAASCLCSLTGCFRFDVFLDLESGSTVAMVSAVAAAVAPRWIWAPSHCSLFGSVARFPYRFCF